MNKVLLIVLFLSFSFLLMISARLGAAAESSQEIPLVQTANDKSSLFVHLPPTKNRNGAALIICPGGGYGMVSIGNEGHDVAKWFNDHGVSGFVLQYRLPGKKGNPPEVVLEDAKAAIRQVRAHAAEWAIDPHRVGILGFSAGGHVAVMAGTHYDPDTRPDFMILVYPVISVGPLGYPGCNAAILGVSPDPEKVKFYSGELNVTKDTPPTFLAQAADDRTVNVRNSLDFFEALLAAHVPAEIHIYEVGDHGMKGGAGYGIGGESKAISSTWDDRALDWMKQRGLLNGTSSSAAPNSSTK